MHRSSRLPREMDAECVMSVTSAMCAPESASKAPVPRPASMGLSTRTASPAAPPSSCSVSSDCMSCSPGNDVTSPVRVLAAGSKRPRPDGATDYEAHTCSPRQQDPRAPMIAAVVPAASSVDPWAVLGSPWLAVVGCTAAKAALQEALLLPLLFPPGVLVGIRRAPCALLLHGPPGTYVVSACA